METLIIRANPLKRCMKRSAGPGRFPRRAARGALTGPGVIAMINISIKVDTLDQ